MSLFDKTLLYLIDNISLLWNIYFILEKSKISLNEDIKSRMILYLTKNWLVYTD